MDVLKGDVILNILLDGLDFNESWAYETLKNIIRPECKICMLPFAFNEEWIKNEEEWGAAYNKINGKYYKPSISPFYAYGIKDENINMVNYFTDNNESAREKLQSSHIIFFTGGLPDRIMKRLEEFDLIGAVEQHKGIIMGWSAGAMMQCSSYFISPDKDYPSFLYKKGLSCIKNFAVEVHYKNTSIQKASIERYMKEKGNSVYTTEPGGGIIVEDETITLLGTAKLYEKKDRNSLTLNSKSAF